MLVKKIDDLNLNKVTEDNYTCFGLKEDYIDRSGDKWTARYLVIDYHNLVQYREVDNISCNLYMYNQRDVKYLGDLARDTYLRCPTYKTIILETDHCWDHPEKSFFDYSAFDINIRYIRDRGLPMSMDRTWIGQGTYQLFKKPKWNDIREYFRGTSAPSITATDIVGVALRTKKASEIHINFNMLRHFKEELDHIQMNSLPWNTLWSYLKTNYYNAPMGDAFIRINLNDIGIRVTSEHYNIFESYVRAHPDKLIYGCTEWSDIQDCFGPRYERMSPLSRWWKSVF